MKGTLSQGVLPGLLRDLYLGRKTGLLYVTHGEERRGVRFVKGHIVRADSNRSEEHLGETLVRLGRLQHADLERGSELALRGGRRVGAALVELGLLDQPQLEEAIALHAHEVLVKLVSLTEGSYFFEEQDPAAPVAEETTLSVPTGEMVLEAVRSVRDPDIVRFALGDLDRVLGPSSDPLLRFQRVTLTAADGYVLSRIDGTLSAREILQLIPAPAEETERSLFGLLSIGMIEYLPLPPKRAAAAPARPGARGGESAAARPGPKPTQGQPEQRPTVVVLPPGGPTRAPAEAPAAPAPPAPEPADATITARRKEIMDAYEGRGGNHFEVLGLARQVNDAQVKEAYFRLARRFHPDAHHDPALSDLKDKLEAVFIRLGEAYEVLRVPRTRASYQADLASRGPSVTRGPNEPPPPPDPVMEAKLAEESVRRADRLIQEEKFWDAIQLLEPAVPKLSGRPRQRARVLLARCYLKNPYWVRRAVDVLEAVIQEDPKYAEGYFTLGLVYKAGGLKQRAAGMFRRTLELKPDHPEAGPELDALGSLQAAQDEAAQEPPEGGGGLLRKLFGR